LREAISAKKTPAAVQAVSSRWRQSCRGGHRQGIQLTTYGSKCFRASGPWPTGFDIESLRPWLCLPGSTCVLSNPWKTKRTAWQERSRDQESFAFRESRCGSVIAIRRLEEYWQISESGKNPSRILDRAVPGWLTWQCEIRANWKMPCFPSNPLKKIPWLFAIRPIRAENDQSGF
jgi:hypothetical protein